MITERSDYNNIRYKTKELVKLIDAFSQKLPQGENYNIPERLMRCVNTIPEKIEQGLCNTRRIDKIRSFIKANGALTECKDYLALVEQLKYANTKDIVSEVDIISKMITNDYPAISLERND